MKWYFASLACSLGLSCRFFLISSVGPRASRYSFGNLKPKTLSPRWVTCPSGHRVCRVRSRLLAFCVVSYCRNARRMVPSPLLLQMLPCLSLISRTPSSWVKTRYWCWYWFMSFLYISSCFLVSWSMLITFGGWLACASI